MKPQILNSKEKVEAAIDQAEKGCSSRLMTLETIYKAVERAEAQLKNLGIYKKYWHGVKVMIDPPALPYSYRNIAEGTSVVLECRNTSWFLVDVKRVYCRKVAFGDDGKTTLILTTLAKENIPSNFKL